MKIRAIFGNWTNAIKTFPVSHILLLVLTILGIGEIEGFIDLDSGELVIALILAFIFSCYGPLFIIHSSLKKKHIINRIFQIGSIVIGLVYYFILYNADVFDQTYSEELLYIWILPVSILGILLIIALFHRKYESKIRFSRTSLFISIVFGSLAGSIVRGGISGALASIEALFDIDIDGDLYADIGFVSEILLAGSFIFNYYLTLTENLNGKSNFEIKPSRLRKIFGSFIFLPLALIYLAIFGAYGIKILITGIRPKGIIVWLGFGYFSLGIVSSYLVYPDKNKVHEIINKILYISFILIAFMMIGAIVKRINQYGITINRCFVCYIIAFIIIFSAFSLIFNNKRLFSFISTLSILSLASVYLWPINVGNISFNSQVNRIETLLSKENISLPLDQGDLKDVNEDSTKLIMGALDELIENYDKNKVINNILNYEYENSYRSSRSKIREFLGVNPDYDYYSPTYNNRYYDQYNENESIDVLGFSKLYNFEKYYGGVENMILKLEVDNEIYEFDLTDYMDEMKEKADSYSKVERKEAMGGPALVIEDESYKLVITGYSFRDNEEGKLDVNNIRGYLLIR